MTKNRRAFGKKAAKFWPYAELFLLLHANCKGNARKKQVINI